MIFETFLEQESFHEKGIRLIVKIIFPFTMISWKRKREENKGDIDEDALEAIRENEMFLKKERKKKGK